MKVVFSVVIPVYNAEKHINDCVMSIVKQDFQSFEIILVDDGSNDKSPDLCDDFALRYSDKIKVIHQINSGQFRARANGFDNACGKYIVNVDADDMLETYALSNLYQIYTEKHVDMIMYTLSSTDSKGTVIQTSEGIFGRGIVSKDVFLRQLIKTGKLNSIAIKSFVKKKYHFDDRRRLSHGEDYFSH